MSHYMCMAKVGALPEGGDMPPSCMSHGLGGALIHGRGNITHMYVTFLLLFQLNFVVQV